MFLRCEHLKVINFPTSLKKIGNYCFMEAYLKNLVLPDSITHIGNHAFAECWSIRTLHLPTKLVELDDAAFLYCQYLNRDELTLPTTLTKVGNWAFSHTGNTRKLNLFKELNLDDIDEIEDSEDESGNTRPDNTEIFLSQKLPNANWTYSYEQVDASVDEDSDEDEYGEYYTFMNEFYHEETSSQQRSRMEQFVKGLQN